MSFSSSVKNEICQAKNGAACCRRAELTALVYVCGSVSINARGVHLRLSTELLALAKRILGSLQSLAGIAADIEVRDAALHKGHVYSIYVDDAAALFTALGVPRENFLQWTPHSPAAASPCCDAAFIRGAFLGSGTVSDPKKNYHLEFVLHSPQMADHLMALLKKYDIHAKKVRRKHNYVLYLSGGDGIARLLALLGAHASILHFENVRVLKETRNNVNRAVNCETANINKTVDAAMQQLNSIDLIESTIGLKSLSPSLQQAAALRLENPQATLQELCEMCGTTKSGMNHRLRKINSMAQSLLQSKEGLS